MALLRITLGTLALVLLVLPAGAWAQATNAPPGNSAIDEYLETVPVAGGSRAPHRPDPKPGSSILTPAQRGVLERYGAEGRQLAHVVDSSAPRSQQRDPLPEADGRRPLPTVVQTTLGVSGGGGLGFLRLLIVVGALLATVAALAMRRRSGVPPKP